MRVFFERQGGFTGIPVRAGFDVDDLDEADAADVRKRVDEADFFSLQSPSSTRGRPDQFRYVIEIAEGDRKNRIETQDLDAAPGIQELTRVLTRVARTQMRRQSER